MRQFYEIQIKHYSQEIEKVVSKTFLVEALSFTESEANVTQYLTDIDITDFEIKSISKKIYSDVVYTVGELDYDWFEAKAIIITGDKAKPQTLKYLIAGKSVKSSTTQLTLHLRDGIGKSTIKEVKLREIEDLVIKKDCEINGTIILGFAEQAVLEDRIK